MKRRIAAILATDMVGYSRPVEEDEVGTRARDKRRLDELTALEMESSNSGAIDQTGNVHLDTFANRELAWRPASAA